MDSVGPTNRTNPLRIVDVVVCDFCLFLDAEQIFAKQENLIVQLDNKMDDLNAEMSEHLEKINLQSEYYRTCNN